ncbi:hypothetical protein FA95DRAFT_1512969 [Auriscalpium vulgare]|uniref:Uncharacterized protein n=1 Tax=Auriscalpium vulgare TaxID=40419 RepID=A0ACB8S5V9_9AGAM|nr:hypothetical protein FA95DRAFT_1512969 [Auriscalpium vulgare]
MAGPPTSDPSLDDEPSPAPVRVPIHRSVSHSSQWSAADTPSHHNIGTSYSSGYNRPVSPSPRRHPGLGGRSVSATNARRPPARSGSVGSSRGHGHSYRDEGLLSEDDEESGGEDNRGHSRRSADEVHDADDEDGGDSPADDPEEEEPVTLKERQSLINVEHPFGLPIWKPALYKKSRSVTRYADQALHSVPSAQAERHLLPGNLLWTVVFGWWLAVACFAVSAVLYVVPRGGKRYASLVFGLGWYLGWPFGKYVEGELADEDDKDEERSTQDEGAYHLQGGSDGETVRAGSPSRETSDEETTTPVHDTITRHTTLDSLPEHEQSHSWSDISVPTERSSLLGKGKATTIPLAPAKSYGATFTSVTGESIKASAAQDILGRAIFWLFLVTIITPLMLIVCIICWGLVITVPMAKLNWALIKHLFQHPTSIRFCAPPPVLFLPPAAGDSTEAPSPPIAVKQPRLAAGQLAPSGSPTSTVLLCIYRSGGLKYYKYTIGGVNILFINLLPVVFFVIIDGLVLLPLVEERERAGLHVPAFLAFLASHILIFTLSLLSVIPLSYFIGMAVASISAQSSIGMGAVINATFGSIIEILLYAFALTQGKGRLVDGSIVGSLLAGVLLMPGVSMLSGALRRKEQKFNAKSAGVTSTMLIMAIIGTVTPTLFYQTYGNFQLVCGGCPKDSAPGSAPWTCQHCSYRHPDPVDDPFYQSTVKTLMYFCAVILLFSYILGLWFSLRTHASQIWQNPQQLLHPHESGRMSMYHKIVPPSNMVPGVSRGGILQHKPSFAGTEESMPASRSITPVPRTAESSQIRAQTAASEHAQAPPTSARRISYAIPPATQPASAVYVPILESVDHAINEPGLHPTQLPENMTREDFTRAVAVATVSALRHQQVHLQGPGRVRSGLDGADGDEGGHGGHDAPSWSRATSASVLLGCTALYAIIAEVLVDVVDAVLEGSGIDEKFLGVTLFALVPNTTEFMNAMSFAMNGNIALSMEIGSAYALQVCLLQIPAMVAFSAWYNPGKAADTFTLIFPRWDVIVIILSIFLLTYTYIEAKANYHRGSILILSYLVLVAGFYFAPYRPGNTPEENVVVVGSTTVRTLTEAVQLYFSSPTR